MLKAKTNYSKSCTGCGSTFSTPSWNRRFCTPECREAQAQTAQLRPGQQIGRWTVISFSHIDQHRLRWVNARCDCGTERCVRESSIKHGESVSCGCYFLEQKRFQKNHLTHGMSDTSEYRSFSHAKDRCTNPNSQDYADYGGRGIEFRFASFEDFIQEIGLKPSTELSINRINNDGHYEKGNVEWASPTEQARNRRPKAMRAAA
jgi:hypothetical protein